MNAPSFFFADPNSPFLVALVVTLAIAVIETLSLVMGLGLADLVDDFVPGFDADTPEVESSVFTEALGWLNVGKVPFLVLLLVFLGCFTVIGYGLQLFISGSMGFLLPAIVAGPLALIPTLPATRLLSRGIAKILPREETYAVGDEDMIGRLAAVSLGPVTRRRHGKAKVTDAHGNIHFVRIRAAEKATTYQVNQEVLLVAHQRGLFDVIAPPESLSS
jgi:Protein of unknown function (DUF1449)